MLFPVQNNKVQIFFSKNQIQYNLQWANKMYVVKIYTRTEK